MYIFDMDGTIADTTKHHTQEGADSNSWFCNPVNFRLLPKMNTKTIDFLLESGNRLHGGIAIATAINQNLEETTIKRIMEAKRQWLEEHIVKGMGISIARIDFYFTSDGSADKSRSIRESCDILIDDREDNCREFKGDSCLVKDGEIVRMILREEMEAVA
jgi:hypothetical protein